MTTSSSIASRKKHQPTSIVHPTAKGGEHASYPIAQTGSIIQRAQQAPNALSASDVMTLQRTIGNRAVTGLLRASSSLQRATLPQDPQGGSMVNGAQESLIHTPQSGGQSVPEGVRSQVEQQTGADLRSVEVYNNQNSHILNRQLDARAFTHQNKVFLGKGESPHDVQLMAHELTHTIQQTGSQQTDRPHGKDNKARPHLTRSSPGIQRKVQNLHIDKRLRRKYDKEINGSVQHLRKLLETYNAIPQEATNYDEQIKILEEISITARVTYYAIGNNWFMNQKWRKLGGPFRAAYYMLQRNLAFIGMVDFGGFAGQEMKFVEQQKENPINQARTRRIEEDSKDSKDKGRKKKKGDTYKDSEAKPKYDFRELERGKLDEESRTFKAPSHTQSIATYSPRGQLLAGSISAGNEVIATGVTARVTIEEGGTWISPALVRGRTMLMYEVRLKGMPYAMVPSTMWDESFGANTYPTSKTPKNPKQFFNWLQHWEYFGDHSRDDRYTEQFKRKLLKLNGFDITPQEGLDPSYLDIPDELYHEGGFTLIKEEAKQERNDNDDLDPSKLEIPPELQNQGGFQLTDLKEDLASSNLEVPQELQDEGGLTLL